MTDFIPPQEIQRARFGSFNVADLQHSIESPDNQTKFVHIGGPSAVGKTTLAHILHSELPKSQVLSIDSYLIAGLGRLAGTFSDIPPDPEKPYIGGITPEVWEFSLLKRQMAELKANRPVAVPIFDQTIKDRIGSTVLKPDTVIILEGGHSFSEEFRDYADYKILVTAPLHDRLVRKAVRTHARYKRDDLDDVWGRYLTKDEPSWKYYEPIFKDVADQIFPNASEPMIDFSTLPPAKYPRAEGIFRSLKPFSETGELHDGESLGLVEMPHNEFQITYSVGALDLVNLPLDAQFVKLLEKHYEFDREDRAWL